MNNDDFEKRLQRQEFQKIPGAWRAEILATASAAIVPPHVSRFTFHDFLAAVRRQLFALLWPHPKAWAGLAAVWLLVMASNYYEAETVFTVSQAPAAASPELIMAIKQQRRELARLVDPTLPPLEVESPRTTPSGPRSQRHAVILAV